MGKKGFSATTFVLVAVLIGALFLVSKSVTPPPAAPPEPPKEPMAAPANGKNPLLSRAAAAANDDPVMSQRKKMMAGMAAAHNRGPGQKGAPQASKPAFNPNSIEVTADYWKHAQPGSQGEAEMRERVAKAKAEEAARRVTLGAVQPAGAPPAGAPPRVAPGGHGADAPAAGARQ